MCIRDSIAGVDAGGEIAAGHAARRLDQTRHGGRDTIGRRHAKPYRPHQDQNGGLDIGEGEGGLDARAAGLGAPVGPKRGLRETQMAEDAGIHRTHHVEVGVGIAPQAIERAEEIGRFEADGRNIALVRGLEGRLRRGQERRAAGAVGPGEQAAFAIDQIGGGEAVIGGEVLERCV